MRRSPYTMHSPKDRPLSLREIDYLESSWGGDGDPMTRQFGHLDATGAESRVANVEWTPFRWTGGGWV